MKASSSSKLSFSGLNMFSRQFISRVGTEGCFLPTRNRLAASRLRQCSNSTEQPKGTYPVGESAELRRSFSSKDVEAFAALSLDNNPLHLDEEAGKKSRFGQRVVHGVLVHSIISALLGTRMPGPGSIYVSQTLQFTAPVFIDEEVLGVVRVIGRQKSFATIETVCTAVQRNKVVLRGEAVVKCP